MPEAEIRDRRTLVVSPNWVGDTVMALPALEALAASGRAVTALAKSHLAPLLHLATSVHQTLERSDSSTLTVEQLRREAFDEAVVLPHSVRSAWLVFRAGIPHRWGYRGRFPESSFRRPLLKPAVRGPKRDGRHQVEDYRELLTALGIPHPKSWTPRLDVTAELQQRGRRLLERARLTATGGPVIGLFPGAEFGPSKRWPWRRFAELGRLLRRHNPNSHQVILAGPKEVWMGVRIHEETGKIHPVVGPDLDLAELAAVLSQLDLLITNDSGPMHLAAALGVPCVALFGPTDPRRTRPSGTRHQILYTDRWCSPCFRRRCPLIHHRCLRDIGVEGVLAKCQEILEK